MPAALLAVRDGALNVQTQAERDVIRAESD